MTTAARPMARPRAVCGPNGSPNMRAPQTAVTGAMRNMSVLTLVTPERLRISQYSPYPPKVDNATSQLIAAQNESSAGGFAAPTLTASTVKMTALVVQWTVIDTAGATLVRERLSRNVAATSEHMPRNGMR